MDILLSSPPFFEEVWAQFGHNIEENGLVHYSKVILMITQKVRETWQNLI